MIISDIY